MQSEFLLAITSARGDEWTADVARELSRELNALDDLESTQLVTASAPGQRGDLALIGDILVKVLGTGAVTALIACLSAKIQRDQSLKVQIRRPDGATLTLEGKHLSNPDAAVHQSIADFLK